MVDPEVLHSRLLARADDWLDVVLSPQPFAEAVRVVLKLHAPVTDVNPTGEPFTMCDHCGYGDDGYPCDTVRVIASALGVDSEIIR